MRRFFIDPQTIQDREVTLPDQEAHHVSRVLRLRPGTQVELFDGTGAILQARLTTVHKGQVRAQVEDIVHPDTSPSPLPLTLMQAVLKGKKLDTVLQKATELGVEECCLFPSHYCAVPKDLKQQELRWQRIVFEACKQCRRPIPMKITYAPSPMHIDLALFTHKFLAHEQLQGGELPLDLLTDQGPVCLFIGPEGGWHARETEHLLSKGCTLISLGAFILRGETAAISACSIIQYLSRLSHQHATRH